MSQPDRSRGSELSLPELGIALSKSQPAPSAELGARIRTECTKDLQPARGLSPLARVGISLVAMLAVCAFVLLKRPSGATSSVLLGIAGWVVVMVGVLLAGASPKRLPRQLRLAIAVLVPVAFFGSLALFSSEWLPLGAFMTEHAHAAAGCSQQAMLFGALTSGIMLFTWRGTDPFSPALTGSLLGLGGGVAGALAIGVACPSGETWHLWLGHGIGVVLFAAVGSLIGRRWLAP